MKSNPALAKRLHALRFCASLEASLSPPVHTLIYEDDAHALEARDGLIAELGRQGFERIACFSLRRDMPWLVGRKLDDCFYVAWHRKLSL